VPDGGYRVLLVSSSGGVLLDLLALRPWWSRQEAAWVCVRAPDTASLLAGERVHWAPEQSVRHPLRVAAATLRALAILRAERPQLIISAGTGVAADLLPGLSLPDADALIGAHPWAATFFGELARRDGFGGVVIGVNTDFYPFPASTHRRIDHYTGVFPKSVLPPDQRARLRPLGIPVRSGFAAPGPKPADRDGLLVTVGARAFMPLAGGRLIAHRPARRVHPVDQIKIFSEAHVLTDTAQLGQDGPADEQHGRRHIGDRPARPHRPRRRAEVMRRPGPLIPRQRRTPRRADDTRRGRSHARIGEVRQQPVQPARRGHAVRVHERDQVRRCHPPSGIARRGRTQRALMPDPGAVDRHPRAIVDDHDVGGVPDRGEQP
jgi:hypothetical protein